MIVSLPLTTLPSMSNEAKRLSCVSIQYSWTCFKEPPKGRLKDGLLQYADKCCNKLNHVTRKPVYHGDFMSDWTTTGLQDQHECCLTGRVGTCAGFIHVHHLFAFFLPFLSNFKKSPHPYKLFALLCPQLWRSWGTILVWASSCVCLSVTLCIWSWMVRYRILKFDMWN